MARRARRLRLRLPGPPARRCAWPMYSRRCSPAPSIRWTGAIASGSRKPSVWTTFSTGSTRTHSGVAREGRSEIVEAGRFHLDILGVLKRVNAHLSGGAYRILEGRGELLPSRLRHDAE